MVEEGCTYTAGANYCKRESVEDGQDAEDSERDPDVGDNVGR